MNYCYDPRISIFVSVDPLADQVTSWMPDQDVHNDPINLIDPTGNLDDINQMFDDEKNEYKYSIIGEEAAPAASYTVREALIDVLLNLLDRILLYTNYFMSVKFYS